jgi:hypothetical protein
MLPTAELVPAGHFFIVLLALKSAKVMPVLPVPAGQ